ncbi:MAG: hypothetical protein O3A46_01735, partial [Candidatus Poribacteria bacterium]|nr:hypothetical protein [Candidatus Poribacteria bacterium]
EMGMRVAQGIIEATDVPDDGKDMSYAPARPDRRDTPVRYDYELRARVAPPSAPASRPDAPPAPKFNRTIGKVIEKSGDALIVSAEDSGGSITFTLPQVMTDDGGWKVRPAVKEAVDKAKVGDAVVIEWWEGEGQRYIEGLAPTTSREHQGETYLFSN